MAVHFVYFHGFASGPESQKGQILKEHVQERADSFICPDLNGGDFLHLTMDAWLQRARDSFAHIPEDEHLILSGSSLGAYTAALLSTEMPQRSHLHLYLIAPAFGFVHAWPSILGGEEVLEQWRQSGQIPFFHHQFDREEQLGYAFYESCRTLPGIPSRTKHNGIIIHGRHDEVVPLAQVEMYAQENEHLQLMICEDDHALLSGDSQQALCDQASILLDACR